MEHGVKGAYVVINGKLRVTQNHPIYTQGKYMDAWMLKVGDVILDENLKEVTIKSLETKEDRPVKVVYNLEVDTHQNYFADGILVHNKLAFGSLIEGSTGGATSSALAAAYVTKYVGSLYEENPDRVTDYIYLGDQRVAAITDGAVNYYHADHLGGSNVITNSSGVMKELTEYDPYGKYSRQESYGTAEEKAFRYFTGKEYDTESELYYFEARYYDPALGRFLTPDTMVPYPEDPQSFNRYSYCRDNPVNLVDPSGHWFFAAIAAVFKFVAAHPVITAGIISAAANVGANAASGNIHSLLDVVKFGAIGYASGAAGAASGIGIAGKVGFGILGDLMGVGIGSVVASVSLNGANAAALGESVSNALNISFQSAGVTAGMAAATYVGLRVAIKVGETIGKAIDAQSKIGVNKTVGTTAQGKAKAALNPQQGEAAADGQALSNRNKVSIEVRMDIHDVSTGSDVTSQAKQALISEKIAASNSQIAENGQVFAGMGSKTPFRDAAAKAVNYGGESADWVKVKSSVYKASDGTKFESHWIQNTKTGDRFEQKTKILRWPKN